MRLRFPSTGPVGQCSGRFCRVAASKRIAPGQLTNQGSVGGWIGRRRKVPQMRRNRVFQCVAIVGLLLTANFAVARDNDDKKDRSDQGGRSSSSSSNSNNSGSSSRSVSSSNDSSRSFNSRGSQSVQVPNADRSTRSL